MTSSRACSHCFAATVRTNACSLQRWYSNSPISLRHLSCIGCSCLQASFEETNIFTERIRRHSIFFRVNLFCFSFSSTVLFLLYVSVHTFSTNPILLPQSAFHFSNMLRVQRLIPSYSDPTTSLQLPVSDNGGWRLRNKMPMGRTHLDISRGIYTVVVSQCP